MAQYRDGTINLKNANSTVIGVNTYWKANSNVGAGDLMIVLSSPTVCYQVANVVSNTEITLSANYAGSNANGEDYAITTDFSPIRNLPLINPGDVGTAALWNRLVALIDPLL